MIIQKTTKIDMIIPLNKKQQKYKTPDHVNLRPLNIYNKITKKNN